MQEELEMLFLLEHFSLEDLVGAEQNYINYQLNNTDNLHEIYEDEVTFDDEGHPFVDRIYHVYPEILWMPLIFDDLMYHRVIEGNK